MSGTKVSLATLNQHFATVRIRLPLDGEGRPIRLGEGRFASVFLGYVDPRRGSETDEEEEMHAGSLVAVKFLRADSSFSTTVNFKARFYKEIDATVRCANRQITAVVGYCGYGRTRELPVDRSESDVLLQGLGSFASAEGESAPTRRPLSVVFGNLSSTEVDALFVDNRERCKGSAFAQAIWTGDFYALDLCAFSLEDLLSKRGDPAANLVAALAKCGVEETGFQTFRESHAGAVKETGIVLKENDHGFGDLREIGDFIARKLGDAGQGLAYRKSVVFKLARQCLRKISELHGRKPDKQGFSFPAHRDIKPGNILFAVSDPRELKLADLGYVASHADILHGGLTTVRSPDEGGVLPSGSPGYRAPEQLESNEDVSIQFSEEIPDGRLHGDDKLVVIDLESRFEALINRGDWLRWVVGGSDVAPNYEMTRILKVEHNAESGGHRCYIKIAKSALPQGERINARLIKDVGVHSDVYAAGCLAYFLGTEGRDPERFVRMFLDETAINLLGSSLPKWTVESPILLAAMLCQEAPGVISDDLDTLTRVLTADGISKLVIDREHIAIVRAALVSMASAADNAGERNGDSNGSLGTQLKRMFDQLRAAMGLPASPAGRENSETMNDLTRLASFRREVAGSPALAKVLRGKVSDIPLSFPQLVLMLLCCMREGSQSFVRRDPSPPLESDEFLQFTSVYASNSFAFASRILGVLDAMGGLKSLVYSSQPIAALGEDSLESFLKVRLAGTRATKSAAATPQPVTPPQARASTTPVPAQEDA